MTYPIRCRRRRLTEESSTPTLYPFECIKFIFRTALVYLLRFPVTIGQAMYHRPNQTDLEEELLLFPKSPHDDLSDTLYYCASMLKAGRKTSMPFNPDYGRGIKPIKQNTLANF